MRIDSPKAKEIPQLWNLWQEAFGDDASFIASFQKTAFSQERCRCAFIADTLASMLFWFDCSCRGEKIAYLYAIATKKSHRGQGLCKALMNDTHNYLKKSGYSGAILVPGEQELFHFYSRLGYHSSTTIGELQCSASDKGIDLRKISAIEYRALRQFFLPDGAVIQENENMDFLSTMAEFYTSDKLLLAGRKIGEEFIGLELLGNTSYAPKVLHKLQCKKGKFRILSQERPFSMYYPFIESSLSPTYFGLAFDL